MKFIHIADVHLGATPDAGMPWSEERGLELWKTFYKIIELCNKEQIDLLLIAGDLFHRQPFRNELKEMNYMFSLLEKTRVVMIAGNHDYIKRGSTYCDFAWVKNVFFLSGSKMESIYFEDLNTEVWGFSYHQAQIKERLYDNIVLPQADNRVRILLAHGGDDLHIPIDYNKLAQTGFDYVALGHIHKPRVWEVEHMAYVGSLEPIEQNEVGPHGYIEGEITSEGTTFKQIPLACREYVVLNVKTTVNTTLGELERKLKNVIEQQGEDNIYKIVLKGVYEPEIPLKESRLYSIGNIISVSNETLPDYDVVALYQEHMTDIIGMYIESFNHETMDEVRQKALYYGLQAIIQTQKK